jgi:hypothetical protein
MKTWYKELETRFAAFPCHIQILNMVSDLKKAEQMWTTVRASAANHLYRAIILLDYMVADPRWKPKLKELLRLREVIGSLLFHENPYATLPQTITAALLLEPVAYRTLRN